MMPINLRVTPDELLRHLQALAFNRDPFLSSSHYFFARTYIAQELKRYGTVETQVSPSPYGALENIILSLPCRFPQKQSIIIGAHYDTVPGSPGADDNASGVAVLLSLAKALSDRPLNRPVRLIAFDLEEYGLLGSQAYVDTLNTTGEKVRMMISLEMLGYRSHQPHSQAYPPLIGRFYPDVGNFIALIGNLPSIPTMGRISRIIQASGAPCEWLPVPLKGMPLPTTRRSDHAPFWDYGCPALMITDTADLRNPHYHQPTDTIETLDLDFMSRIASGLVEAIATLAA